MKARNLWLIVFCAAVLAVSGIAWAAAAHFVKDSATILTDGTLQVCFKEAGLGDDVVIDVEVTADATAIYRCVNPAGQCIDGHEDVAGPVSGQGTFTSGKNGTINGCLTVAPPPPVSGTCPGGSAQVLAFIDYTNIKVKDLTNNVTQDVSPGTVSEVLFKCKK